MSRCDSNTDKCCNSTPMNTKTIEVVFVNYYTETWRTKNSYLHLLLSWAWCNMTEITRCLVSNGSYSRWRELVLLDRLFLRILNDNDSTAEHRKRRTDNLELWVGKGTGSRHSCLISRHVTEENYKKVVWTVGNSAGILNQLRSSDTSQIGRLPCGVI